MKLARLGPALLVAAALALLLPYARYLTDDSYIHFQFVKHLLRGEGFAFNAGVPTYGATSPLWVLLLAAVGLLVPGAGATPLSLAAVPPLVWVAKALGALATVAAVLGLLRLGRRLGWPERDSLLLGSLLALHAWAARWGVSGMETPLALALVILSLDTLAGTLLQGRPAWRAGVALALAALARPEALLLALLAGSALALARPHGGASRAARAGGFAVGFALPYGAWLATAHALFHRFLPNTSGAKAGAWLDPERAIGALRDSIRIALAAEAAPLAIAVVAAAFGGAEIWKRLRAEGTSTPAGGGGGAPRRLVFWSVVTLWPLLLVAAFAWGGVQVVSRYLLIATPSVLLLGIAGLRHLTGRAPSAPGSAPGASGRAGRAAAAALLLIAFHAAENAYVTFRVSAPAARAHADGLRASLASIGIWARQKTAPTSLFAVADIGAFAYYSDRPVLDLYGLVTPPMGPMLVREGYDRIVFDLAFETVGRPAYLVDRARTAGRLTVAPEPDNPYRFLFSREIPNLGITRPGTWHYSVYAIDWATWDRLHPRFADR
jgi:hypothetical protein